MIRDNTNCILNIYLFINYNLIMHQHQGMIYFPLLICFSELQLCSDSIFAIFSILFIFLMPEGEVIFFPYLQQTVSSIMDPYRTFSHILLIRKCYFCFRHLHSSIYLKQHIQVPQLYLLKFVSLLSNYLERLNVNNVR